VGIATPLPSAGWRHPEKSKLENDDAKKQEGDCSCWGNRRAEWRSRARHLQGSEGGFTARAITRNTDSEQAKELGRLGAEVVAADIDDPESLARAFQGAYGAYCVTFFWAHFSPEKELAEAQAMAEAAKHANLEHVIWSTLEDTSTSFLNS
jgi:hypothetical protein